MDEHTAVADYLARWLDVQRTQLEASTWASYAGNVRRYLLPHLGHLALRDLTVPILDAMYAALATQPGPRGRQLSLRTVRFSHAVLHKALGDAVKSGIVATNPAAHATLPRRAPDRDSDIPEVRVWTALQLRAFLDATAGDPLHRLWVVAAGTGMRRGELLGLRREDVGDGVLHVRRSLTVVGGEVRLKRPKSSRSRALRLDYRTATALAEEAALPRPQRHLDLIFTEADGSALDPMRVTHAFRTAVARTDLARVRLHDLRHTHATLLLQAGVPVKVVSERLGHATVALTLDIYAHVLPAMDADAAERFGALLDAAR